MRDDRDHPAQPRRVGQTTNGELDDLVAAGTITPATIADPWVAPAGPMAAGLEAGALIRRLRDEERY